LAVRIEQILHLRSVVAANFRRRWANPSQAGRLSLTRWLFDSAEILGLEKMARFPDSTQADGFHSSNPDVSAAAALVPAGLTLVAGRPVRAQARCRKRREVPISSSAALQCAHQERRELGNRTRGVVMFRWIAGLVAAFFVVGVAVRRLRSSRNQVDDLGSVSSEWLRQYRRER
jgi:hypothetical protein